MERRLDERFLRILKIFKWGRDAEKALEVLRVKVDPALVRHVMADPEVEIEVKLGFFKWASDRRHFVPDPTAYMSLIGSLHSSHMFAEMWRTVQAMTRRTPLVNPADFSQLVNLLTKSQMVNQALTLFHTVVGAASPMMTSSPTRYTNSMFSALLTSGRPDKVLQIYAEMSASPAPVRPDATTYGLLLSSARRLGRARAESAWRIFEEMKENRLAPDPRIYTTMIRVCFDSGEADRALGLLEEMTGRGLTPTVFTCTEVVRGLGAAGRDGDAYQVFVRQVEGGAVAPDVVLVNAVLNVLGRAGRLEEAVQLFGKMRGFGCRPNVVTYNTMIKATFGHGRGRRAVSAAEWVRMMEAEGVPWSGYTFSILVDGFCKTNRVEAAVRLMEEREEKGLPVPPETYCSVIAALGRSGRWEVAEELFWEVKEVGGLSSRAYAVMIKHLGRRGRVEEAVRLFGEAGGCGRRRDVYAYNAVMSALVRSGDVEGAVCMMERMGEDDGCSPDLNSHNIILNGFARSGGPWRALEMLRRMEESSSDVRPDVVSYNTVLGCLSHAGLLEEAAGLMKEMREKGVEYDRVTYSSVIDAVGTVDETCRAFLYIYSQQLCGGYSFGLNVL